MANSFIFTTGRLEKLELPPGGKRQHFRDAKAGVKSLYLAVSGTGRKVFYLYRWVDGRPARIRLGEFQTELTLDQARKRAAKMNGEVAQGADPRADRQARHREKTFGELFTWYLETHAKPHKITWDEDQRQYDRYLSGWRHRKLSTIARSDIQALHIRMGAAAGPYQANRVLSLLSCVFNKAASCSWLASNPAQRIKRFREESRERFLLPEEMPRFLEALSTEPNQDFQDFFTLALLVGARRANLQAMRWEDVALDRALWAIPRTKSGKPLLVPLCARAVDILRRRHSTAASPWVFPSCGKSGHLEDPKAAWQRLLNRAGITNLRVHDLRRTFGSWQALAGTSLPVIGKSLGHSQPNTTAIYARLTLDPVRESVEKATGAMMATTGGTDHE